VVYNSKLAQGYVDALLKEIDLVGSSNGIKKPVTSLYFGGGSPALLADEFKLILNKVQQYFEITQEIGVELHPADVTQEKLQVLKDAGITRISIGVQSFQDQYLELLGRSRIDYQQMFKALSQVHFETVAMDFIFALPGQTLQSLKCDIDTAFANGANHIAIYPFIDFAYTKRDFEKLTERQKKHLMSHIADYCDQQSYVRDSIWTFAKQGINKYSSMTRDNFLGFGCSATTLLKDQFKINTFSIEEYIARVKQDSLPTSLTLRFTERQRMVYYLFWTAYTTDIDVEAFNSFFGRSLKSYYGLELNLARVLGFIKKSGNSYTLTTKGAYYFHYFENYFTLSYINQMWGLMRETPFPEELVIS
jgi:oxygen-independent coproporphyrinogen-3 oxidase